MRATLAAFTIAIACATAPAASAGADDSPPPGQVMVLGTFHFTGGGSDMINPEVDDFLAPHRQAEIAIVLDRLETFAPTRIAVELTPEHEAGFNARYLEFVGGERELGVNERQQIGMRLAARLGHDRLYAVDHPGGMDFDAMLSAAQTAGQTDLLATWESYIGEVRTILAERDSLDRSILQRLVSENSQPTRDMHNLYLLLAQMGGANDPTGAREMTNWWGRNLHIFSNIAEIAEPGERVLVIYGAGHKALLDAYIQGAPNIDWIEPLDYLAPTNLEAME
ncbi:hypothetical protein AWH62_09600 [Maricaulis sp. W15]|uniref:DUF5694 domain-containing protein n=1 Tax=Maricaulis sp. W15 TaxID=1772333 RepID=UPI00094906D8|nr:DUF5694 domain-containing protein [Maricaulis sp. W15]OLF73183.1 hypothetical protein AWH62_09600 [Maricaulis sp. W15]